MNKKVILFSLCSAGALFIACSDESSTSPKIDDSSLLLDGTSSAADELIPGNSDADPAQNGMTDPANGQQATVTSASSAASGDGNSAETAVGVSSAGIAIPDTLTASSTSSVASATSATVQSSSSGLKDYDDNHLPKDSFLPPAGFYSSLTIDPPTPQKGGEIKCTFDGSFPTAASEGITAAKQITENTVIRCSEFVNGVAADTTTQTYFINESVSMPVVALTVNHHDMFDSTDGLYATGPLTTLNCTNPSFNNVAGAATTDNNNPKCTEPCYKANFWCETELPVHVEYFENGSSTTAKNWEIDAGISIIGNWSRYKPKKSVAIKMDDSLYNDKTLKYSLFKTRPEAKKFKSFNLRNNGNRFWTDYYGDAMLTSLMEGTEVDYQRSRQVVVFYNGEYFGIHDMRERLNRGFAETNYGIDNKSINVLKNCSSGDGCVNGWEASGTDGASTTEFSNVVSSITSGNFEGENNQSYAQIKEKFNVSSFAQYMMAEMYIHNGDWPGNNIRFWGSPANGQPFKAMIFDVDHGYGFTPGISGFDTESENMFSWVLGSTTMSTSSSNQGGFGNMGNFGGFGGWSMGATSTVGNMLSKLLANPDFKRLFINQSCILLDSYLTYEKVQAAVQNMNATIPSAEQTRDEARWPRNQGNFTWSPSGSDLLRFGQNRSETVRSEMATYFSLSNAVTVNISASGSGAILVDEMTLPSTNYSGKFFAENQLQLTAVPGSGRLFTGWSDGSTENPHLVTPSEGLSISANFK